MWNIKSFPGGKEYLMRAHLSLPSVEGGEVEAKPPIQVKFEIPYFTTSGIQVSETYLRYCYLRTTVEQNFQESNHQKL